MKTKALSIYTVLLFIFIFAARNKAFSQCFYVSKDSTGVEHSTAIPCDFPVRLNTGNPLADQSNFNRELKVWNTNNPTLSNVNLIVSSAPKKEHLNIPKTSFDQFSPEKQKAILAIPYFFIINP